VEQRLAHRPYGDGGVAGVGPRRPDPFPSRLEDPLRESRGGAVEACPQPCAASRATAHAAQTRSYPG